MTHWLNGLWRPTRAQDNGETGLTMISNYQLFTFR
jgi:hypothetical protein